MSEKGLLSITRTIWIAFTIATAIAMTTLASSSIVEDESIVMTIFLLASAATLSTLGIWFAALRFGKLAVEEPIKAKRVGNYDRIARLTSLMDEDEIVELETMLKQRDYNELRRNSF